MSGGRERSQSDFEEVRVSEDITGLLLLLGHSDDHVRLALNRFCCHELKSSEHVERVERVDVTQLHDMRGDELDRLEELICLLVAL